MLVAVDIGGQRRTAWSIACGESPNVSAVILPAQRIVYRILPLRNGCALTVREIVDATLAHILVLDAAQVEPNVCVLVPDQWPTAEMLLTLKFSPSVVVGFRPFVP